MGKGPDPSDQTLSRGGHVSYTWSCHGNGVWLVRVLLAIEPWGPGRYGKQQGLVDFFYGPQKAGRGSEGRETDATEGRGADAMEVP